MSGRLKAWSLRPKSSDAAKCGVARYAVPISGAVPGCVARMLAPEPLVSQRWTRHEAFRWPAAAEHRAGDLSRLGLMPSGYKVARRGPLTRWHVQGGWRLRLLAAPGLDWRATSV